MKGDLRFTCQGAAQPQAQGSRNHALKLTGATFAGHIYFQLLICASQVQQRSLNFRISSKVQVNQDNCACARRMALFLLSIIQYLLCIAAGGMRTGAFFGGLQGPVQNSRSPNSRCRLSLNRQPDPRQMMKILPENSKIKIIKDFFFRISSVLPFFFFKLSISN